MENSIYQELCTQYYELEKPSISFDEWNFYYSFAKETEGRVLEPMCGTGRLLVPLAKAGFLVEGFDASESMLRRLYEKAKLEGIIPCVWLSTLEALEVENVYNLVLIPVSSFNLLTDMKVIKETLYRLYRCLKPGGKMVLEIMQSPLYDTIMPTIIYTTEVMRSDRKKIQLVTTYSPLVDGIAKADCAYKLLSLEGTIEIVEKEQYALRFYDPGYFDTLLIEAGFVQLQLHKLFERGVRPDLHASVVIYEAQK